jgi:hypothetical protein
MLKLFSLKSLAVLAAMLTLAVGASGCDWLDGPTVFTSGSVGGFGLGCNDQSCDWLSGNYITVTITHAQSHDLLSVAENCINGKVAGQSLPGTCMAAEIDQYLNSGAFQGIEQNAMLDSNCLYGVPPAGYCTSGYGTYGVSLYYAMIGYAWGGYDARNGCIGFRVNLFDVNYQSSSWFYTGVGGGGDAPGGSECDPTL